MPSRSRSTRASRRSSGARCPLACPARRLEGAARLAFGHSSCFTHIGSELIALLEDEFENNSHNTPASVAARQWSIQYLGELAKFKVVTPEKMFGCLKQCLDSFGASQAQVVCTLLETCGRYLHRRRDTQAARARARALSRPASLSSLSHARRASTRCSSCSTA